jgi:hypothetical protein
VDGAGPSTPIGGKRKRELTPQMLEALAAKHRAVMEGGYAVNTSDFGNKLGLAVRKDVSYKQIDARRLNVGAAVPLVPDAQGLCRRKGFSLRVDYGLVLRPHQVKAVCLIFRPSVRGMFLNYGMGVGKSLTAVACADNLVRIDPTYSSIVVICPAGVRDYFEATFAGTPIFGRDVPIRVLTWHAFGNATMEGQVIALCLGSILIFDEVHNGRNQEGRMASKAVLACRAARKVILMSGTPVVNHPSDIGVILNMIRPSAVPSTRELFEGLFGESGLERHTDLLRGALRCVVLSHHRDPADPSYPRRVDAHGAFYHMTSEQREAHARQHAPEDDNEEMAETDRYFTRIRQIANAVYLDAGGRPLAETDDQRLADAECGAALERGSFVAPKFRAAVRTFVRGGMPQTVFYTHWQRYGVDVLAKLLRNAGIPFGVFAGARRDDVVRRYNLPAGDPERYRAIVLTDAGSEGLNLLETRHVHVMEPQFNRGRVEQAIARAIRKGSHARLPPEQRTVTVHEHFCVMPDSPETDRVFVTRRRRWSAENSGDSVMRLIAETKRRRNDRFVRLVDEVAAENEAAC